MHTGYHFPVISFPHWHLSSVLFYITCILPVIWAYPNVNQHFSSKSRSECPSVCPVLFRFQQCVPWMKLCYCSFCACANSWFDWCIFPCVFLLASKCFKFVQQAYVVIVERFQQGL